MVTRASFTLAVLYFATTPDPCGAQVSTRLTPLVGFAFHEGHPQGPAAGVRATHSIARHLAIDVTMDFIRGIWDVENGRQVLPTSVRLLATASPSSWMRDSLYLALGPAAVWGNRGAAAGAVAAVGVQHATSPAVAVRAELEVFVFAGGSGACAVSFGSCGGETDTEIVFWVGPSITLGPR